MCDRLSAIDVVEENEMSDTQTQLFAWPMGEYIDEVNIEYNFVNINEFGYYRY